MLLLVAVLMFINISIVHSFIIPSSPSSRRGAHCLSMNLNDQINGELKAAMKAKDKEKLTTLRNIRAAFLTAMKEDGAETLPDEQAFVLLRKVSRGAE